MAAGGTGGPPDDGLNLTDRLGLPWKQRTRQVQGRVTEKKILKAKGARAHPNSGAGRIKDDGSSDEVLYEVKDANKSFSMKGRDLKATLGRAEKQGREARWIVYFTDADVTAELVVTRGLPR